MRGLDIEQTDEQEIRDDFKEMVATVTNYALFTVKGGCIATFFKNFSALRRCCLEQIEKNANNYYAFSLIFLCAIPVDTYQGW
jgi:hypothetical protein